jgi:hypothetical protein
LALIVKRASEKKYFVHETYVYEVKKPRIRFLLRGREHQNHECV